MFENLLNLVKENAGEAIINNPSIPNEKNNEAISETTNGIMDGLKEQLAGGNLAGISNLFSSGNITGNPIVGQISQMVTSKLSQKFGLDANASGNIVSSIIPKVMEQFVHKTNDPNDQSFNMDGIMASLSSQSGGLGGMVDSLKGMFGGN